jgi:hypothetical protein
MNLGEVVGQAGGPGFQIALFGQAGRTSCGLQVGLAGGSMVTCHLQQMRTYGGEAVMAGYALVLAQRLQKLKARRGSIHHCDCSWLDQADHRMGREVGQDAVQRDDLRPVGVLRTCGFSVDRGYRRLKLEGPGTVRQWRGLG